MKQIAHGYSPGYSRSKLDNPARARLVSGFLLIQGPLLKSPVENVAEILKAKHLAFRMSLLGTFPPKKTFGQYAWMGKLANI